MINKMNSKDLIKYFSIHPVINKEWDFSIEYNFVQFRGNKFDITFYDGIGSDEIVIQVCNKNTEMVDGIILDQKEIINPKMFLKKLKPLFNKYSDLNS